MNSSKVLRVLAESAVPVATTVLAGADGLHGRERMHALTHVGGVLRTLEKNGLVRRTGTVHATSYNPLLWEITDPGREYLERGTSRTQAARARDKRARNEAARQARREMASQALASLPAHCISAGRERHEIAVFLHDHGCTYAQIGTVFGVTSERARQIVFQNDPQSSAVTPEVSPEARRVILDVAVACLDGDERRRLDDAWRRKHDATLRHRQAVLERREAAAIRRETSVAYRGQAAPDRRQAALRDRETELRRGEYTLRYRETEVKRHQAVLDRREAALNRREAILRRVEAMLRGRQAALRPNAHE